MRPLAAVALALALAAPARAADAPLRRFAVVAGASFGGAGRTPLRYAASDARDVSRVLRRLGGVALDDLQLLDEPDSAALRAALGKVAAEAEGARRAGGRVELFVYYSGHSDEQGLLLGASRLEYAELRRELDRVPADVRVAILDSCASGAITRAKGGVHRPPFLLDESSRVKGHAFLTSSAADEAAQESDRLHASFFTHALLTGLRGAADASGDGVVTLNEAYQFAFRETLAGTEATQAGPQHATYDIGLVGSGDVVMTDLRRADALLVIPEPLDGRVFVRTAAGQLVAELRKVRGARVELALEEGRYDVRVASDRKMLGATITLAASGRLVLDETKLWPVPVEVNATRGDVAPYPPYPPAPPALAPPPPPRAPAPTTAPPPEPEDGPSRTETWVALRGGPIVNVGRKESTTGREAQLAAGLWYAGIGGVELASGISYTAAPTRGRLPLLGWVTAGQEQDKAEIVDLVRTVPVTLTFQLALPSTPVRPYVGAGGGLYFTSIERRPGRIYAEYPSGTRFRDEVTWVALHFGAGATVQLSRHAILSIDFRYSLGRAQLVKEDVDMNAVHLLAGAGWRF